MNETQDRITHMVKMLEATLNKNKFDMTPSEDYMTELLLGMLLGHDTDLTKTYRVKLLPNDQVQFSQLEFPREIGGVNETMARSQLPEWADELLCVLAICDQGASIPHVGVKMEDDVYYLIKGE